MKYTSDILPPVSGVKAGLEVPALTGVKHVKPVGARSLPPLVIPPHKAVADILGKEEEHRDHRVRGERRTYCRRFEHLPLLIELRSAIVRRRHKQRASDLTEHVDIKV